MNYLGLEFREMTDSDREGFAGAEDDAVMHVDSGNKCCLIYSPSARKLSVIVDDGESEVLLDLSR